ncbi:hypothetical protein NW762_012744 [Fusarium torreyae]|uniref:SMP-30/Gluconolactonase/LRE-like region domain-containing protein n=1 Tax=Fusarium torreyae TaxID=1237075 RepID=A0A9W8RLW3_9HYPO|nr:hypothetical protein NW762_012744 [Fusarium torreyae]
MNNDIDTNKTWQVHHHSFNSILGTCPKIDLLLQIDEYPFAHEAGVFFAHTNELFITSNQFKDKTSDTKVQISKISSLGSSAESVRLENVECDIIHFANGGVNYKNGILFCAQGSGTSPSGLFHMQASPPYTTKPVLTSYLGEPFNSVNDVVVHSDGSIWFTDPSYGHDQGYRPRPSLPNQVYRYDPVTDSIRAVADGFGRPNGICFSPDQTTVYITDTDQVRGPWIDRARAASIYAFDVIYRHGQPFLANRRLFAYADSGIPDGIKCDTAGNVYSGCPDGINVWSPGGILLGKITISGGVANFCFGSDGQIFALNEHRLWRVQLDPNVQGALLATGSSI